MLKIVNYSDSCEQNLRPQIFLMLVCVYMVEKHMVSESVREKKKVYYQSCPKHEQTK